MTDPSPSEGAKAPAASGGGRGLPRIAARYLVERVRRYRWFLLAAGLYLIPVLVLSRLEILASPGQFPQGTNALNAVLHFNQMKLYPLQTWYAPFTDWGLPMSGYTGPTVLYLGTATLDASSLARILELGSFWISGITAYLMLRNLGAHVWGATTAGFYYMMMAQTPHFFEGHVPFMISLAVAPIYLLAVYRFGGALRLSWGLITAISLYLLASIGDLGCLYFLLFFSIPLLVFSVVQHGSYRNLTWSKVSAVGIAVALFLVVMAPWWLPYALGARPQFFTGITVTVAPFASIRAQPLDLAYAGISIENSFSRIALGHSTYALDYALLAPLFFVVPAAITIYVVVKRTVGRILLYLGGWLAILISTGPSYPGISSFNDFLYSRVPYFDYIPLLSSWLSMTIIVYTVFVGWLVSDIVKWFVSEPAPDIPAAPFRLRSIETETFWSVKGTVRRERITFRGDFWRTLNAPPRRTRAAALAICILFIVVSVGLENSEVLSSPPQYFQFPAAYVAGFNFIKSQPAQGGVLTVPFGAIYERTPWGGVSASSEVMAPYFTNTNSVVFEAGTPYSLAMDWLIWHSLSKGFTDNLTKFLEGTNVQFVTTTNYPNWAYSSSSFGSPRIQYENLYHQEGLGSPVFTAGNQAVYSLGDPVGNLSFHPSYFVYFGSESLVNEITNQPLYNGTQVLVNASQVDASALPNLVGHASALVFSPTSLSTTSPTILAIAATDHVPIVSISGPADASPTLSLQGPAPWNSSNAVAVLPPDQSALPYVFNQTTLLQNGAASVNGTVRVSCPPGALLSLQNGLATYPLAYPDTVTFQRLFITNSSLVSAGIANGGKYPYNGSVTVFSSANGTDHLLWKVTPQNRTFQYLSFALHDLTGDDGLTFTLGNESGLPASFEMQLYFNQTHVDIPSYRSASGPGPKGVSYSFLFSDAKGPGVASLNRSLGNIRSFQIGTYQTGLASTLNVTSISFLRSYVGSPYRILDVPSIALTTADSINIKTSSQCRIDTLAFQAGNPTFAAAPVDSDLGPQANPLELRWTTNASGWGLLLASDTFSPLWQLSVAGDPSGSHLVADLGLNAWLVNLSSGEPLTVQYLGQGYQSLGILIEGVGLPVIALFLVLFRSKRSRSRLRKRLRRSSREPPIGSTVKAGSPGPGPPSRGP